MYSIRFTFVFAIVVVALSLPLFAMAQQQECTAEFCPLANVQGSKLETLYRSNGSLADFVSNIFTMAISAGAILAVIRLSWAGYLYMTTDSWGSKGHAKEVIGDVVLGLLLLLGIWLILWQINPDILKLNFLNSLKQVQTSSPTTPAPARTSTPAPAPQTANVGGREYVVAKDPRGCYVMISDNQVSVPCPSGM